MNIDDLQRRRESHEQDRQRLLAAIQAAEQQHSRLIEQINACQGAIQEIEFWIAQFKPECPPST